MTYSTFILPRAQRELAELQKSEYERVKKAILLLGENPRPVNCRKLSGREGWRLRVGNYRAIYSIDDDMRAVTVLQIGHRRNIYR